MRANRLTAAYITTLFYLTLGIIIILLGIIILRENPKQRINRVTAMMMFFAGMGPIFGAFGLLLQASPEANLALAPFRRIFLIWEFFFPQMLLFSFLFPREIQWAKKNPLLPFFIFVPHVVHFLLVLSFSSPEQIRMLIDLQSLSDQFGIFIQPITILLGLFLSLLSLLYEFHTNFFAVVNLIYIIAAIVLMVWGYRGLKNPRLQKQVGLVLWGIRASVGLYAIAFIFPHLNILHTSQSVTYLLTSVALLVGAASIAWAIIRYQFLDIRLIIRKGLIFSLSSALLIGIYLLVYSQGKRLISGIVNIQLPLLEILFIIFALLFFQPILGTIERLIERIFMRDRLDHRNVLNELSREILTTLNTDELSKKMTTTLKEALSLESTELILANRDGSFVLQKDRRYFFDGTEEWISVLHSNKEPLGFDELTLRVSDDTHLESLRLLGAYLLVPFIHRESLMGILILGQKITKTTFTTEDLTIFSVLANQAAIALENARLYRESLEKQRMEEELDLAKEIQNHLLPSHRPYDERFELAGYNLPSKEVGGDYYDFIPLDDQCLGIAIGDISGKGIPAAILMSNLQAALRISAARVSSTKDVIRQVNSHITRTTTAEKFATFFYGVLNCRDLTLEYTNAGHNYPILHRKGKDHALLREGGIIIGVMEGASYESRMIRLNSGDSLILYTDGITEALDSADEEFGENRLLEAINRSSHQSAQYMLDHILESVIDFTHGYLQSDDLTLVVLKIK